jgi:hypothetical protein
LTVKACTFDVVEPEPPPVVVVLPLPALLHPAVAVNAAAKLK